MLLATLPDLKLFFIRHLARLLNDFSPPSPPTSPSFIKFVLKETVNQWHDMYISVNFSEKLKSGIYNTISVHTRIPATRADRENLSCFFREFVGSTDGIMFSAIVSKSYSWVSEFIFEMLAFLANSFIQI